MSNEFLPEDEMPDKKSSQQRLLLLLLLLIGLFAYLYFFTGLIKPRETPPPPPQPTPQAMVKKPLPPRPEAGAAPAASAPAAGAEAPATPPQAAKKPAQPAASANVAPGAKPAASAPEAKPAAPVVKPAKPVAAPQAKAEKPAAPAAHAPQAAPGAAVKPGAPAKPAAAAKPAAPGKEAKAAAEKKAAPAAEKKVAKPAAEPATSKAKQVPVAAKPAGAYAIEMDGDLVESELGAVTAKLKRAGISHVVKTTSHKNETMHRLYLADFANHDEAAEELQRLKAAAPSAFLLKENGRYTIYAGSYLREGKAAVEQDRLFNKGVKLLLKSATVSVPVVKLRAGSFADKAAAAKAVNKLKQAGLSAKVVKVGK